MKNYPLDPELGFAKISKMMQAGAEWCEVLVEDTSSWYLIRDDKKTNVSNSSSIGVSVYAIAQGKSFHSCCDGVESDSINRITDAVCASLKREGTGGSNPHIEPFEVTSEPVQDTLEPLDEVALSRKLEVAQVADEAARGAHPKVSQITVVYHDLIRKALVLTSEGRIAWDNRSMLELAIVAFLRVGGELIASTDAYGAFSGFEVLKEKGKTPEAIAKEAVRKAALLIDAKPSPEGEMPVVFAPGNPGVLFHEACGHSFEADFIQKGSSFSGKMGKKVASELVTLVDSGRWFGSSGSFMFDDQGNPSQKTTLIENGILTNHLYDMRTAMIDGVKSTGNGRCETFRHPPIPRMSNTYVENGADSPESILADTKSGIYIKSIARGGNVDVLSGDFVVGVGEGYVIENGKPTYALKNATISGNGQAVLLDIDAVANNLEIRSAGRCGKGQNVPTGSGLPTLRVRKMIVGGGRK